LIPVCVFVCVYGLFILWAFCAGMDVVIALDVIKYILWAGVWVMNIVYMYTYLIGVGMIFFRRWHI
jgi:hypothetical protein